MAIDHSAHDHPATPAARAACRKMMAAMETAASGGTIVTTGTKARPAVGAVRLVGVEPRRARRVATVNGGAPVAERRRFIRTEGDMADVPHVFSSAIRHAWVQDGWTVRYGNPYNNTEKRIVIDNGHGDELELIYKAGQHHVNAVDYRPAKQDGERRRGIRVGQAPHVATGIKMLKDRATITGPMTTPMN
jgi:hypothetical protein